MFNPPVQRQKENPRGLNRENIWVLFIQTMAFYNYFIVFSQNKILFLFERIWASDQERRVEGKGIKQYCGEKIIKLSSS